MCTHTRQSPWLEVKGAVWPSFCARPLPGNPPLTWTESLYHFFETFHVKQVLCALKAKAGVRESESFVPLSSWGTVPPAGCGMCSTTYWHRWPCLLFWTLVSRWPTPAWSVTWTTCRHTHEPGGLWAPVAACSSGWGVSFSQSNSIPS